MKIAILVLSFLVAGTANAAVGTVNIKGKITSFDEKSVTIEIAGENYKFDRKKLGKSFSSLKSNETVEISVDTQNSQAKK